MSSSTNVPPAYEDRLAGDLRWALSEGSLFFEGQGAVQAALAKITKRLKELGIPYAVAGGMALFAHGVRRFTENVDILVTSNSLTAIHRDLDGRGFVRPFEKSKNLREADSGVRIGFLIAGQFPGDGKPKPVAFPEPSAVSVELDGIRYVNLPALVELKLASGMTSALRMKDLADVQELIKTLGLTESFAVQLNAYVRAKFQELIAANRTTPRRYLVLWPLPEGASPPRTLDELMERLPDSHELRAMRQAGVLLDPTIGAPQHAALVSTDPDVARRFGLTDESEYWGLDDEDGSPQ